MAKYKVNIQIIGEIDTKDNEADLNVFLTSLNAGTRQTDLSVYSENIQALIRDLIMQAVEPS